MAEIKVFADIMKRNRDYAAGNRKLMSGAFCVNIMSSPGAGKTTLLEKTLQKLKGKVRTAVIEGDITTSEDAKRLKKYADAVYQIKTENYGGGCHLDARMVRNALAKLHTGGKKFGLIIIENVGNLICPADFDLGENKKVVMLSAAEGEEKPLKYPLMFQIADLMILSKTDLIPHTDVSVEKIMKNTAKIKKKLRIIEVSARNGQGVDAWVKWLMKNVKAKKGKK